jgi:peptidyl-prolyl cis-trans isomerase C
MATMRVFQRSKHCRFAPAVLVFCWFASFSSPSTGALALYTGGQISEASLEAYILSLPPGARRPAGPEQIDSWRQNMLEELLVEELLIREARAGGILKSQSFEHGWKSARTRILAEAMLAQATAVMEPVSREGIEGYYQDHLERYRREEAILTRHIFLRASGMTPKEKEKVRRRTEKLRGDIVAGADFAELAKKCSDSENASEGGLLPWQRRGTLNPDYERAAWSLKEEEISKVVETQWGFHIIRLERR